MRLPSKPGAQDIWGSSLTYSRNLINFVFSCILMHIVLNVHLEELSCLLGGETSRLGVVLMEWDA